MSHSEELYNHAWGWQYQHNSDNMLQTFSSSWIVSVHYIHWIFHPRTKLCISTSRCRGTSKTVDLNDYGEKIGVKHLVEWDWCWNLFSVFPRNWRDNNVERRRSQCASFYLRIGTVCQYLKYHKFSQYFLSSISVFGIGSLIHTGIEIGDNFEAGFYAGRGSCLDIKTALRSSLQMVWNIS